MTTINEYVIATKKVECEWETKEQKMHSNLTVFVGELFAFYSAIPITG
jgi:hypothetical protein